MLTFVEFMKLVINLWNWQWWYCSWKDMHFLSSMLLLKRQSVWYLHAMIQTLVDWLIYTNCGLLSYHQQQNVISCDDKILQFCFEVMHRFCTQIDSTSGLKSNGVTSLCHHDQSRRNSLTNGWLVVEIWTMQYHCLFCEKRCL